MKILFWILALPEETAEWLHEFSEETAVGKGRTWGKVLLSTLSSKYFILHSKKFSYLLVSVNWPKLHLCKYYDAQFISSVMGCSKGASENFSGSLLQKLCRALCPYAALWGCFWLTAQIHSAVLWARRVTGRHGTALLPLSLLAWSSWSLR